MAGAARAQDVPYHFYNFECPRFLLGTLPTSGHGLELRQGRADIASDGKGVSSGQHLALLAHDPLSGVVIRGNRLASDHQSHAEVWVRPLATSLSAGEEFMDFDGAVVGLFRSPEAGEAEFYAFHQTSPEAGYWLSSGRRIAVDAEGKAAHWHRLHITHHWEAGTWALELDGAVALTGLYRSSGMDAQGFECWLFGHTAGVCEFDDLLISPLPPDALEAQALATQLSRRVPPPVVSPKTPVRASSKKSTQRRQHAQPAPGDTAAGPAAVDFRLHLVSGGKQITSIDLKDNKSGPRRATLYTPSYDEKGQRLPLQVEIRSDAHLREGLVLADLEWSIIEIVEPKEKKPGVVISHGNFATGPTQLVTVPAEWTNKGVTIRMALRRQR